MVEELGILRFQAIGREGERMRARGRCLVSLPSWSMQLY